jgi:hypothetical protein
LLAGTVFFDVTERWQVSVLRVRAEARLDVTASRLRYSLSVGGICGWMSHRMRIAGAGPDYTGFLGSSRELQVTGWRNRLPKADSPSLTLMIHSSSLSNEFLERLLARSLGTRS